MKVLVEVTGLEPENFVRTWREIETLVDKGLVKNIGTSNMTRAKLEVFLPEARIRPAVNEMELHPHLQQKDFLIYVVDQGIQPRST